jgi:hypothetical protein
MRRLVALALSVLLAMSFTACGSDDEPDTADDTRATTIAATEPSDGTSTTTAAVDETEAEILAAVDGYWSTIQRANRAPDPDMPELLLVATGFALDQARLNLRERRDLGQASRSPEPSVYRHEPIVQSVDGETAVVSDCSVDDTLLYEVDTGLVVNDDVATLQWRTTVVRDSEGWKVSANELEMQWEGLGGCAVN